MAVTSTIMLISNAQSNAHTMGLIPFLKSHDNYMPDASLPVKLTLMLPNFERIRNSTILREFVALCEGYALPTFDKDCPENMKNRMILKVR